MHRPEEEEEEAQILFCHNSTRALKRREKEYFE